MLGFGFNKARTLASAEKNVRQGRLNNAIADYEKIVKEEPHDLALLNTIGDLCVRAGKAEQAAAYFKQVGDAYAAEGFTVKAIAMYKKVTRQDPKAFDIIQKLGELYAQRGLNNDARVQYTLVADDFLHRGDPGAAMRMFQRILDLDPDNEQSQARLAELYGQAGQKSEARDLYYRCAQSQRTRGAVERCEEALRRALLLDPSFTPAVLLRAQIRMEANDPQGAAQCLEALPGLDSRPEALHLLLRAQLKLGNVSEATPLARKLLSIFNDVSGVALLGDALTGAGDCAAALSCYQEFAPQLLAADAPGVLEKLHRLIARVKDDSHALETLCELFTLAGSNSHLAEVNELLAHACVQDGALAKARELYKWLAELEPHNPMHLQNYQQVRTLLGEDADAAPGSRDQLNALMEGELEHPAVTDKVPVLDYPPEVAATVQEALTDAELFSSYSQPERAAEALERALKCAPRDLRLNQELVSLYARVERPADAAECCRTLQAILTEANEPSEAQRYLAMAQALEEQSRAAAGQGSAAPQTPPAGAGGPMPVDDSRSQAPELPAFSPAAPPASPPATTGALRSTAHEIDLSDEWEQALFQEPPVVAESAGEPAAGAASGALSESDAALLSDIVEEARFCLLQAMQEEARQALARAEAMAPGSPEVARLRAQLKVPAAQELPHPEKGSQNLASPPATEAPAGDSRGPAPEPGEPATAGPSSPVAVQPPSNDELRGMVTELEEVLGDDFGKQSAPDSKSSIPQVPTFAAPPTPPVSMPASIPVSVAPSASIPAAPGSPSIELVAEEAAAEESELAGLFDEFRQEVECAAPDDNDPDRHYSLGIAFKEMGLLDEAVGELQKVCAAIEAGRTFSQELAAYTWLADCFVQLGLPEAAVKWYERALRIEGLSQEKDLAIHYELACAHQAAGDRKAARLHLVHVLSINIDYRDVAERLKALKSVN
jgi:tetratricopeptide (TPR) repeat protein